MNDIPIPKRNSITGKIFLIGILVLVTWIPTLFVDFLVSDRADWRGEAVSDISEGWGGEQSILGPIVSVPVLGSTQDGREEVGMLHVLPTEVNFEADLDTETRSRGIHSSQVYTGIIRGTGTLSTNGVVLNNDNLTPLWDRATLSVGVADPSGVQDISLLWNETLVDSQSGVGFGVYGWRGVQAPIRIAPSENASFSFEISLRGSDSLKLFPVGDKTSAAISADWSSPSFVGSLLPVERKIGPNGFEASWRANEFTRSSPRFWYQRSGSQYDQFDPGWYAFENSSFGVQLFEGVDLYSMVERTIKYSILFIILTFTAFFMFEVVSKLRVHPMNYLLIGFAVGLFYLLLLSFAEHIGFGSAYLVASTAITLLITFYSTAVLKSRRRAFTIAALLAGLYGYLYVLLQLEDLALLFGSLFLFVVLASIMFMTRHIDWYDIGKV
jgi:inner membrane protein